MAWITRRTDTIDLDYDLTIDGHSAIDMQMHTVQFNPDMHPEDYPTTGLSVTGKIVNAYGAIVGYIDVICFNHGNGDMLAKLDADIKWYLSCDHYADYEDFVDFCEDMDAIGEIWEDWYEIEHCVCNSDESYCDACGIFGYGESVFIWQHGYELHIY